MKMKITSMFFVVASAIMLTQFNCLQAQNLYGGLSVGYGMRMGGNDFETSTVSNLEGVDEFGN